MDIKRISTDESFIKAMTKLHDKDLTEYQLKLQQFKTQLFLTVIGVSIIGMINYFLAEQRDINFFVFVIKLVHENWVIILIIHCIATLISNIWIIPLFKIRRGIPANEANSSKLLTVFLLVIILILICVKIGATLNFAGYTNTTDEETGDTNSINQFEDVKNEGNRRDSVLTKEYALKSKDEKNDIIENEGSESFYTRDQSIVNYYVPKCKQEIFDIEFWSDFQDNELSNILNGIYAYEGRLFSGNYFDVFPWYNGHIKQEDFTDDMLCHNQHKNIANIISVLKQRGLR